MKQIQQRIPDDLAEQVELRAREVGVSRNEWINRALRLALSKPGYRRVHRQEQI